MEKQKKKTSGGGLLSWVIAIVFWSFFPFAFMFVFDGIWNFFHSNFKLLQYTKTVDLNEIIAEEGEFPEGEFVSLDVHYPLGVYAENTEYNYPGDGDLTEKEYFVASRDYYYLVLLEDGTFMTLQVANNRDIRALDRLTDQLANAEDASSVTDYVRVHGRLERLDDDDLKKFYVELLTEMEYDPEGPEARLYVLNTTAIPTQNVIILAIVIGGILLIWNVTGKSKKASVGNEA